MILDTNVVSEVMAQVPDSNVLRWLNGQDTEGLYLSTITLAEIRFGLAALPAGRRRRDLEARFERFVSLGFASRILVFDEPAAGQYGELMAHRRRIGRPMSALDGQIAAIAKMHSFAVVTRNLTDFEECGLDLVNPFLGEA
jgi:toxin FitB